MRVLQREGGSDWREGDREGERERGRKEVWRVKRKE